MNYIKLAQIFNSQKGGNFHAWRKSENEYWVSDTYALFNIDHETFQKFKSKYSSYKKNPYIKDLEVDEKVSIQRRRLMDDNPDMKRIIEGIDDMESVSITKFLMKEKDRNLVVYAGDGFTGIVDEKYFNLFGYENYEYRASSDFNPLFVFNFAGELVGAIMPERKTGVVSKEISKLKKAI